MYYSGRPGARPVCKEVTGRNLYLRSHCQVHVPTSENKDNDDDESMAIDSSSSSSSSSEYRWLLGHDDGGLFVLVLKPDASGSPTAVSAIEYEYLGTTNPSSTLSYLDAGESLSFFLSFFLSLSLISLCLRLRCHFLFVCLIVLYVYGHGSILQINEFQVMSSWDRRWRIPNSSA